MIRAFVAIVVLTLAPGLVGAGVFDRLGGPVGGEPQFLPPDEAFRFNYQSHGDRVTFEWSIEDGYYLYRDKFKVTSSRPDVAPGTPELPAGEMKDDPEFGPVAIHRGELEVDVPVAAPNAAEAALTVSYQGCAEDGICYPPIKQTVPFVATATGAPPSAAPPATAAPDPTNADAIAARLGDAGLWSIAAWFFVFGLLLSFTPCVFPMVPILSGIIVGQDQPVSPLRGLGLSSAYVFGMAATYAVLGLAAGQFGAGLQASFQHPAVIIGFALVFVVLALSMFDLYHVQMPHGLQARFDELTRGREGGNYFGVALMGIFSAAIVGPCVAPPLAGALLYLSHQGSPWIGGAALFALGLGMGAPLLVLGASAGAILPRAGRWMDAVKHAFGFVLLAVAVWFLERILPGAVVLLLWAGLLIAAAAWLGAFDSLLPDAAPSARLGKGLGFAGLVYAAMLIVGAGSGASDPLAPLRPLTAGSAGAPAAMPLQFIAIKGPDGLRAGLAEAARRGTPAMLDFYADWCIECKHLERKTFQDEAVRAALREVTLLRADVTANDAADRELLAELELYGPPALVFFDHSGEERRGERVVGFVTAEAFLARLDRATAL